MTNSKGLEPLPAYLARVSSLFVFSYDFPMGYITLLMNEEDGFQIRC